MRWPATTRGLGTVKASASAGLVVEPGGDEQQQRGDGGEDVVLLAGGEREKTAAGWRPRGRAGRGRSLPE